MLTTTPKLTLGQRIMADEDPLLKIVKIVCFIAVMTAGAMLKFKIGPEVLQTILAIGGTAGYGVASLTVKIVNRFITEGITPGTVLETIDDAATEVQALKTAIKTPVPVPDFNTALKNAVLDPAKPPAIVNSPEAPVADLTSK